MTTFPSSVVLSVTVTFTVAVIFGFQLPSVHGLGSGSTLAVSYNSATVCGIVAGQPNQGVECYRNGQVVAITPNISYRSIAGGRNFFCGLDSGGTILLCWDTTSINPSFSFRRVYHNDSLPLSDLAVGDDQVCALVNNTGDLKCWRAGRDRLPQGTNQFVSISSGIGFSCGILKNNYNVLCWGTNNTFAAQIQNEFGNTSMHSIVAGGSHVCGLNTTGFLVCKGNNGNNQLNVPSQSFPMEFSSLALGSSHSCAIRLNGSVICWGGNGEFSSNVTEGVFFELIVAGLNFTCGLTTKVFSVMCWGPGWSMNSSSSNLDLPLAIILPGPCVQSSYCGCGIVGLSGKLCSNSRNICKKCSLQLPPPPPPPPPLLHPPQPSPPSSPSSKSNTKGLLAFAIVGSVGAFSGVCTIIYGLWTGICCGHKKVHNSVQPTMTGPNSNGNQASNNSPPSRSSTIRRQGSRIIRRQRSGTSSKHTDRAEEFSFAELAAATNNFSPDSKIGGGSYGTVYKGKLSDGREVAIKRGETGPKSKRFQEKESAFESEIAFLSRLHHKHLVRLVGFCEEMEERLLVYEYMKNGAIYDHLHDKNNVEKNSSVLNSWKMRIKISLDAARGIEYLHNYAVPPIIHRDIKSSNILLDVNWTARVSDFGLSLMGPESDRDYKTVKAAGTVGYIDPEYYGLNVLTAKTDVYGLGVVLLELLTGKRAIFKNGEDGCSPASVVDYAVPAIIAGELVKVLDSRVGPPELNEAEAVELVAYTAMHCVNLEGKERPTMTDIVANLERALSLCEDSHGSISSATISIVSE